MEYADYVAALRKQYPDLADAIGQFNTLENVLQWMRDRGLALGSLDLVTQDEFTHDVLVPLAPEGPFVVFGIT